MAGRGAKPGERRGGRQKGTPNKRTAAATETLEALGCDPIAGMARIAMNETAELGTAPRVLVSPVIGRKSNGWLY